MRSVTAWRQRQLMLYERLLSQLGIEHFGCGRIYWQQTFACEPVKISHLMRRGGSLVSQAMVQSSWIDRDKEVRHPRGLTSREEEHSLPLRLASLV